MHDYTYERPVKFKVPWFGETFLSKQCFDIGILRHFNTFILYKYLIIITQERIFDGMLSSNVRGSNSWYFPNCTSFYKRLITSSHGLLQTWFSCCVVLGDISSHFLFSFRDQLQAWPKLISIQNVLKLYANVKTDGLFRNIIYSIYLISNCNISAIY